MIYVYPVTHSAYPTFFMQQVTNPVTERTAETSQAESESQSQRPNQNPYQEWDDGRGRYFDILA